MTLAEKGKLINHDAIIYLDFKDVKEAIKELLERAEDDYVTPHDILMVFGRELCR